MSTIPPSRPLGYVGIRETNPPQLYFRNRAPTAADAKAYQMGDLWVDQTNLEAYILILRIGIVATWVEFTGGGTTETITGDAGGAVSPDALQNLNLLGNPGGVQVTGTPASNLLTIQDLRNITTYVVDATAGETEYQTIQSALIAADAAGGGSVWVRPGTYTEDLTLYDNVDLIAAGATPAAGSTVIIGTHIPPPTGVMSIRNFQLTAAVNAINSAAAGTTTVTFIDCLFNITNGHAVDLINWTGLIVFINCHSIGTQDGWLVSDSGAAGVLINACTMGVGATNIATPSGTIRINNTNIQCQIELQAQALCNIRGSQWINTIAAADDSTLYINNSNCLQDVGIALSITSSVPTSVMNTTLESSGNPNVIAGNGTIIMGSVLFPLSAAIAGTITQNAAEYQITGPIEIIPSDESVAAEDAWIKFNIPSAAGYSLGIDNSDSDSLKLTDGIDPSNGSEFIEVKTTGDITFNAAYEFPITDGNAGEVLVTDGAGNVDWGPETSAGELVQQVYASTSAVVTCTTAIPVDNSIPQSGEGDEVLTLAITPRSATNILHMTFNVTYSNKDAGVGHKNIAAIYQDATVGALGAGFIGRFILGTGSGDQQSMSGSLVYRMVAGTTSATTFKVRCGPSSTGNNETIYVNADQVATRSFGGVDITSFTINEIAV